MGVPRTVMLPPTRTVISSPALKLDAPSSLKTSVTLSVWPVFEAVEAEFVPVVDVRLVLLVLEELLEVVFDLVVSVDVAWRGAFLVCVAFEVAVVVAAAVASAAAAAAVFTEMVPL